MKHLPIGGVIAASIIALCTTGASAQNLFGIGANTNAGSLKDVPVAAPYNWTGVYAGAHAGYAWGSENLSFPATATTAGPSFDGGVVGGQVGAQWQFYNNAVLGFEFSYTGMGTTSGSAVCVDGTRVCASARAADTIQVVGRLGYASGNFLPYIKGGYANTSLRTGFAIPYNLNDEGNRQNGWVVGGGIEYALIDNVVLGIDYAHVETDSTSYFIPRGFDVTRDAQLDMITFRGSFKLSFGAAAPLK